MCTFVTSVLPESADLASIRAAIGSPPHALRPLVNESVRRYIGAGASYYRPYGGICDCGVALGSAPHEVGGVPPLDEHAPDLRKKGWSETKILRWLENKRDAAARKAAEQEVRAANDLRRWHRLLDATVRSGASPWAALLIHEYSGSLETEEIFIEARKETPISQVDDSILRKMRRDVLYVFAGNTRAA